MGTFGGYTGQTHIKEEQKEQFTRQIMKILNYGGMMSFEAVNMYGSELGLLIPAKIFPGGECRFWYNYFEDTSWETAGFNASDCDFWSNKIGSQEFDDVVTAANFLYEVYDGNPGFVEINGEIVHSTEYVGWINHLLGTDFSMKKRFRLWENAEYCAFRKLERGYDDPMPDIMDIIPYGMAYDAGGTELADLMYIMHGTDTLVEEEIMPGTYPADVYACREALENYFRLHENHMDTAINRIWELTQADMKQRAEWGETELKEIAEYSLSLPARVIIYLTAEYQKKNFWAIWKELHENVYHDESMKKYASRELEEERRRAIEAPIPPVRTSDFLKQDSWFTFHDTPKELAGRPNYYISDDDRLYWWDGSDEVIISEKTDQWLRELAAEHQSLMHGQGDAETGTGTFLEKFLRLLIDTEQYYKRIYPFQTMFYEFLDHGSQPEYAAAVELFKRLGERNKEAGKIIENARGDWDLTSRNVTHNAGRMQLKRYLSVMANKKLRMKYFGF